MPLKMLLEPLTIPLTSKLFILNDFDSYNVIFK